MTRAQAKIDPIILQQPTVTDESLGTPFRAYEFSDADFRRLKKMIFDYAGISLNDNKKPMAYSRLTKRIRQLGHANFREYLDFVEHADSEEHVRFINALTTNLTYFFREAHHFTILSEHLLKLYRDEPLTVWSAACSTGEEPYSIAMAAIEAFGSDAPPVRIIASDLDTDALAAAKRGVYALDKVASLTPQRLKRFFLKGAGDQAGFARIRPQVQRMVEFHQVNLHEDNWPIEGNLAAIFCRNVMIYFNKETQTKILDRFAPLLRRDGLLFAGHSENFFYNARDTFRIRGKTVYELASS
ncbi:MAG: chemotaxis protein CheR [Betaproteobacteria bacterium]|nr:chemotaxis protein CheR [Betaproteobacteria bacterium]